MTDEQSKSLRKLNKEETRLTKTMAMIIGSYLVCWMPMTLCLLGITITGDYHHEYLGLSRTSSDYLHTSFFFMAYLNSAIDPLIYVHRMRQVKRFAQRFFMCARIVEVQTSITSDWSFRLSCKDLLWLFEAKSCEDSKIKYFSSRIDNDKTF